MNNNKNRKVIGKKLWTPEELLHHFLPVYNSIFEHPRSGGFIEEVDPEELGIPDYFDVIKNPMALCTILKKLHEGTYKNPWEIVNDFWLMFNNCLLFNKKSTPIYKDCLQLIDVFGNEGSSVMKKLGFCCANLYFYEPKLKSCCTTKNCLIKNNYIYYKADSPKQEFLVCEKCYNSAGEIIELSQTNKIAKNLFIQLKNDVREEEEFIQCGECGREWHSVCALYRNDGNEFLCEGCRVGLGYIERYSARIIPASNLSKYIENQVNSALKKLDPNASEVVIRDFINKNNSLEYHTKFKERYSEFTQPLEYTSRAIYAFTKIEGVDVMFYGIHSQEYSPNINGPNKGCVNITYLDSVSFFQPSSLKTILYQQILMSYLDYIRRFDIIFAYLWVCPPEIGNDYIFHRHPVEQKLPKKDRLKAWYESAFRLGIGSFVLGFENIVEFNRGSSMIQPTDIPYFDGDFWPTEIENLLIEIDKEIQCEISKSMKEEKLKSCFDKCRKRKKKSKGGHLGKKRKVDIENVYEEINNRFNCLLNKWGDDFIVVKLMPLSRAEIEEFNKSEVNNEIWVCETLETRDRFLPFCKDFNLEFSTLRRVKYSTMHILYEIVRDNKKNKFFCNICHKTNMRIRYFCESCIDYDLCENCYMENPHIHEMSKEQSKEEIMTIEQYAELIYHAFNCNDDGCLVFRCDRVKAMKKHIEICITKNCQSCKNMVAAMMNHSQFCKAAKCNVYSCKNKKVLKESNPNIDKVAYKSPNPRACQPLLSSTPKSSMNSEHLQPYFHELMTEIPKLKAAYSDLSERDQAFSIFMRERPYLNKAYLLLKAKLMKKKENAKVNSQNVGGAPAVSLAKITNTMPNTNISRNAPNHCNQTQPGLDPFHRRDIQNKFDQKTSFPQMIRHPQTNQIIPVRSIFHQTQNQETPYINSHSLSQIQDNGIPQTPSYGLPHINNNSLSKKQDRVFPQMRNHGIPQSNNYSLSQIQDHGFPQKPYHGLPQSINHSSSQIQDHGFPQKPSYGLPQSINHSLSMKQNHVFPQSNNFSLPKIQDNTYHQTQNHFSLVKKLDQQFPEAPSYGIPNTTNHSLSETPNHIYIKPDQQYVQFNPNKSISIVKDNVSNIPTWNSQQSLRRVTNIIKANSNIKIKTDSAAHNVGVVRIGPRDKNLIRIDPSKSTRVTSEIPRIRIIKP